MSSAPAIFECDCPCIEIDLPKPTVTFCNPHTMEVLATPALQYSTYQTKIKNPACFWWQAGSDFMWCDCMDIPQGEDEVNNWMCIAKLETQPTHWFRMCHFIWTKPGQLVPNLTGLLLMDVLFLSCDSLMYWPRSKQSCGSTMHVIHTCLSEWIYISAWPNPYLNQCFI